MVINEDSRSKLVSRSKSADKEKDGKTRYQKRLKSKIASSNKQYNRLDMNKVFKQGIIDIDIHVNGETDDYDVKLKFGGFLDELSTQLDKAGGNLDLRVITRAIIICFNREDVYVHCTCPDATYRQNYWQTKNDIISGDPETRPSDETNPNDTLGAGCKHVMLVLANTKWIIKVASVIHNYINYIKRTREKLYADVIYPAIYGTEYTEPTQTSIFDDEESSIEDVDNANDSALKNSRFQQGNKYRYTPKSRELDGQQEMEYDDEV